MLENHTKKILLLSDDPADVSFLSEIAFMQHAELEPIGTPETLCSRIAQYRSEGRLLSIFVEVTHAQQLQQFEHLLQTRLGIRVTAELKAMIHFISGAPLMMNREVMRSPYFSFYSERIKHDFKAAADFYWSAAFYSESETVSGLSFDPLTRNDAFDYFKKAVLSQNGSTEWLLGFRTAWDHLIEAGFPARFDLQIQYFQNKIRMRLGSRFPVEMSAIPFDRLLANGVSVVAQKDSVTLWIPVFASRSEVSDSFRFMRWINEN